MKKSDFDNIDGLFQDQLMLHEVSVSDRDALWSRIKESPDRRRYLFLVIIGFIGACGFLFSSNEVYKASGGGAYDVSTINSEIQRVEKNLSTALEAKGNDNVSNSEKNNSLSVLVNNPIVEIKEVTQSGELLSSELLSSELLSSELLSSELLSSELNSTIQSSVQLENRISKEPISSSDVLVNNEGHISFARGRAVIDIAKESVHESSEDPMNNIKQLRANLRGFSMLHFDIQQLENVLPDALDLKDGKMAKCFVNSTSGRPYVDIYSNLFLPFDNVTLNDGFQDQFSYRDTWINRISTLPSISGGLSIGYEFKNGLDISVGVEYQKMESQYQYTQTVNEITTVFDPMAYFFINDQGETIWVADSVTAINRYDRTISVGSSTTLINIPLQVSYPIIRKGSWEIKASAAGILNLTMQNTGQFLREDLMLQPLDSSNENSFFKSNIEISYELGAHFGYHISEHLELYVSPRFRYNPNSYLVNTSPLSLSRSFGGLRLGAQYHF